MHNRSMELLVLAGGVGTRLRSVVSDRPKALAQVAGRPCLYYLMEGWMTQGVTNLTFLLHHHSELIENFLVCYRATSLWKDCAIRTVIENKPLGTGGSVAHAVKSLSLSGSFLVANADTWLGSGIEQVIDTTVPAMAVVQVGNTERYGSVRVEQHKVVAFEEKQNTTGSGWINAGLYHLSADLFDNWNGEPFSIEREFFPKLVVGGQLRAVPLTTDFIDIGIPEDYFRFCRWIESGKTRVL